MSEKIILTNIYDDAVWFRLREKFADFDVEEGAEGEYAFDMRRDDDIVDDVVYFWGRDGWRHNFYHAKVTLQRDEKGHLVVWLEQGPDERAAPALTSKKTLESFMAAAFTARNDGDLDLGDDMESGE